MFSEVIKICPFKLILEILIQIIYTISFLYHYKIYHNDLNFGNILLVKNIDKIPLPYNETIIPTYIVKIIDYGLMTRQNPLTRIFEFSEHEQRPFCDLCYIFALFHRYRPLQKDKDILDNIFNPICGKFIGVRGIKASREILGDLTENCNRVNASVDFNATINTLIMRVLEQWRIAPGLNS
jgi:serine/threonine protein kinase